MTSRPSDQVDLQRIADAYPEAARSTPIEVRERLFTDTQRAAWDMRFGGGR